MIIQEIHWCDFSLVTNKYSLVYFHENIPMNVKFMFNEAPYNRNPKIIFDILDKNIIIDSINAFIDNIDELPKYKNISYYKFGSFTIDLPEDILFYAKLNGLT